MDSSLINSKKGFSMNEHISFRSLCILLLLLYMFFCVVYCFMHAYDRSLVNITSLMPCLVSINSSPDDLIESVYYTLIPMQHISVLRIFNSLYMNIQSSSYANYHAWRQRVVNFPSKSESHIGSLTPPEV